MKVYAYSGLYEKACDLYEEIKREGVEPDAMMQLARGNHIFFFFTTLLNFGKLKRQDRQAFGKHERALDNQGTGVL